MNTLSLVIKKDFFEKSLAIAIVFFALLLGAGVRPFFLVILAAILLAKDLENGKYRMILTFPVRRWQLHVSWYLLGVAIITVSVMISAGVRGSSSFLIDWAKSISYFAFMYGLASVTAQKGLGNFLFPFLVFIVDAGLSASSVYSRYSLLNHASVVPYLVSAGMYFVSLYVFSKEGSV